VIQKVFAGVVVAILLGLGFYGGRAYQNNIDQKLLTDYNPPTVGARVGLGSGTGGSFAASGTRAGRGAGSTRGQSPQVRAALSVGSPPGTNSATSSGSSAGSSAGTLPAASQSTSGQLNRIVGTLSSVNGRSLSVQSFQGGSQSVSFTPQTRFYKTVVAAVTALAVGEQVTIRASGTMAKPVATTITIGPAQLAGSAGRFGGGGGGFGGVPLTTLTGTITSVGKQAISVAGVRGSVALTTLTRISRFVSVQAKQLSAGAFVTVSLGSVQGRQVATTVVARSTASGRGGFTPPGG
jgi:hypothetical protein